MSHALTLLAEKNFQRNVEWFRNYLNFFFLYTLEIKIIFLLYLRGLEIVIKCYKVRKYSSWDTH